MMWGGGGGVIEESIRNPRLIGIYLQQLFSYMIHTMYMCMHIKAMLNSYSARKPGASKYPWALATCKPKNRGSTEEPFELFL